MDIGLLFQTLLKLYVLLLLGFVLAKAHILDEHANRSLSQMVVSVTYPLMLLYSMAGQPGERRDFSLRDLMTPGFLMTLLAIILYLLRYDAPTAVKECMYMVGSMTVPLSMIVLGSSLASYSFRDSFRDPWVYAYAAAKLLLMPSLAFGLCRALPIGAHYSGLTVLNTAVPAGSMILMLALQMKRESGFISRAIFVSTLFSALTLPIISLLFL